MIIIQPSNYKTQLKYSFLSTSFSKNLRTISLPSYLPKDQYCLQPTFPEERAGHGKLQIRQFSVYFLTINAASVIMFLNFLLIIFILYSSSFIWLRIHTDINKYKRPHKKQNWRNHKQNWRNKESIKKNVIQRITIYSTASYEPHFADLALLLHHFCVITQLNKTLSSERCCIHKLAELRNAVASSLTT